jgi:hypothetical protein
MPALEFSEWTYDALLQDGDLPEGSVARRQADRLMAQQATQVTDRDLELYEIVGRYLAVLASKDLPPP